MARSEREGERQIVRLGRVEIPKKMHKKRECEGEIKRNRESERLLDEKGNHERLKMKERKMEDCVRYVEKESTTEEQMGGRERRIETERERGFTWKLEKRGRNLTRGEGQGISREK